MCKIYGNDRNVELKVMVYRRPHMRDSNLEYELHMGRHVLEGIFDEMRVMPEVTELFLSFPENWTNIIEQRLLFQRLEHYCPNLKKLTIKTQSVYIIQCTPAGCCFIVTTEQEQIQGLPSETTAEGVANLTDKLYVPMVGNVIDASKLNVL